MSHGSQWPGTTPVQTASYTGVRSTESVTPETTEATTSAKAGPIVSTLRAATSERVR